jgi:hypothetical protein
MSNSQPPPHSLLRQMVMILALAGLLLNNTDRLWGGQEPPSVVAGEASTPQAVIQKHLQAIGGAERLAKIETQLLKAEAQQGNQTFTMELRFNRGGKLNSTVSLPGGRVAQGGDGQGHWWLQTESTVLDLQDPKSDLGLRELVLSLNATAMLEIEKQFGQLVLTAGEPIGDRACRVVEARTARGLSLKLWFEVKSGLLAKVGGTLVEEYRPEAGVLVPHRFRNADGLQLKINTCTFNEPMAESLFSKPSAPLPAPKPDYEYTTLLNPGQQLGIVRHPSPGTYRKQRLVSLPVPRPPQEGDLVRLDLRSADLSNLAVGDRLTDLLQAHFDTATLWPKVLPEDFVPADIMERAKNPGLGLRTVHQNGITGKGIGLAIIDQPLLVDHVEYKDRLKSYEEIRVQSGSAAEMHSPAVASIAVGQTVGVAPGADLYYTASSFFTISKQQIYYDFTWMAKSIDRLLEINATLPKANRIRVISISSEWMPGLRGCAEADAAVERAKQAGVFVVSVSLQRTHKLAFKGLGRDPRTDPDRATSYGLGSWWARSFADGKDHFAPGERLLVPMEARTTASNSGERDYQYHPFGGPSWVVPYLAGLYALACQANPDVTPELFWATALKTGRVTSVVYEGKTYELGTIVNPAALIGALQK